MSRVDEELAQAVAESEAVAHTLPAREPVPEGRPAAKRSVGLLLALLVMGGGILTLVMTNLKDSTVYSRGVKELLSSQKELAGRNVRVNGMLVKGTLTRRDQPCEYRFTIQGGGEKVAVRYPQCIVPDTFRDVPGMDVEVTAEGTLNAAGHFDATHIMAKCPSKYEMKERAKQGEQAPHLAMPPGADLRN